MRKNNQSGHLCPVPDLKKMLSGVLQSMPALGVALTAFIMLGYASLPFVFKVLIMISCCLFSAFLHLLVLHDLSV